jgi:CubicO group peptidase (beta-lactamase class C family)
MILRIRTNVEPGVTKLVARATAASKVPGMSVAIKGPGGILRSAAAGHADLAERRPSTAGDHYPWFSMSKIATATAAMRLHDLGRLDLDAPVGSYLTGYRAPPRHGHPTTRQLLTHTAGLRNPMPIRWVRPAGEPEDPALLARIVARHGAPRRAVGAAASYSNIGYLLAADVMQAATGRTVQECVAEHVLDPLGMHDTGYAHDRCAPRAVGYARVPAVVAPLLKRALPDGIVGPRVEGHTSLRPFLVSGAGYGGLIGPATDAVKLAAAHLDDERMRTITARGKRFDHGIGWFRRPADADRSPAFVEHYGTGCGYWNAMRIYPELGLAMVAMTNTSFEWGFDDLFTSLAELQWD